MSAARASLTRLLLSAFLADEPPGTGDLHYNGNGHTWLASGIGIAGPDFFILDITNPSSAVTNSAAPLFSRGAGSPNTAVVIGEWSSKSISCVNVSNCVNYLGTVTGQPLFRKLHNGPWGVIFGNALGSTSGDAGIFIMLPVHQHQMSSFSARLGYSSGSRCREGISGLGCIRRLAGPGARGRPALSL